MIARHRRLVPAVIGAALLTLGACETTDPAGGGSGGGLFMSPAQEAKIGAEEHPKVLAQFGGVYDDPELGAYVAAIGGRLVAHSEKAGAPFTFTVLNSAIVNAFALPGGYVYVTRGLIALANSEAELASVLAHEIGHVTARHTARRYSRATMAGLGSLILGAVTGNSMVQELAKVGSELYLAGFSRQQESQADRLGVRYLTGTGYDPFAEADFLATLARYSALEAKVTGAGGGGGGFFATHPSTPKRVREAIAVAAGAGARPYARPRHRDRFLDMIDGITYGDDPRDGVVDGRRFVHPALGFTFTVPPGFQMSNTDEAVIAKGPGPSYIVFDAARVAPGVSMQRYLSAEWGARAGLTGVEPLTVNGMEAATGVTRTSGQGGRFDIRYIAIRFSGARVYRFRIVTPVARTAALAEAMRRMTYSFRRLRPDEAPSAAPRIRIVTVKPGDTVETLASRMAVSKYPRETFLVLNALTPGQPLKPGQKVKLVSRNGPRRGAASRRRPD